MTTFCTDGDRTFAIQDTHVFELEDSEWVGLDCSLELLAKFVPGLEDLPARDVSTPFLEPVQKANPYRDAEGRYTSKEHAKTVDTLETDLHRQMQWIQEQAKLHGKETLDQLLTEDPGLFMALGKQWRRHHTYKADPIRALTSFKEDGDALLQMISGLHINRLASWGFIAESDMRGLKGYRLSAVLDNRTSEFCKLINGRTFLIEDARPIIENGIHAEDPNDLRVIQPWPRQNKADIEAYGKMSDAELVAGIMHVPPFHPSCRTIMVPVTALTGTKPKVLPDLQEFLSTIQTFKDLGIKLSLAQVEVWNTQVGLNPAVLMSTLSNTLLADALAVNSWDIKITAGEDVKLNWETASPLAFSFEGSLVYSHFTGVLKQLSPGFKDITDYKKVSQYFSMYETQVVAYGLSVGATTVQVLVEPGSASTYLALGYLPSAGAWKTISKNLRIKLGTDFQEELSGLTQEMRQLLNQILDSADPYAAAALMDLGLPTGLVVSLLADVTFTGFLDLTNSQMVSRHGSHL